MPEQAVTTWYLELTARDQLAPALVDDAAVSVVKVDAPVPEFVHFLYTAVGGDWYWRGRLPWTYDRWRDNLERPGVEVWLVTHAHQPAGYAELNHAGGETQIVSFGVLPDFCGRGLGGHLLSVVTEAAFTAGAGRVWLHTCSLDAPHALAHYQSRGFELYKEETAPFDVPPEPPGPWPGAKPRVRRATADDAPGIAFAHVRAWQAAYRGMMPDGYLDGLSVEQRTEGWRARLEDGLGPGLTALVVDDHDGGVAGFAMLGPPRDTPEEGVGELWAINMRPDQWSAGRGRVLLRAAEEALSVDSSTAVLWVVDENARARRFYEKGGWEPDGATKDDGERGFVLHEVRYRKRLA